MRHSSAVYFVHTKFTSAKNAVCLCRCDSSKPKEKQTGCISNIIIVVWTIHLMKLKVPPIYSFSFGYHESQKNNKKHGFLLFKPWFKPFDLNQPTPPSSNIQNLH